MTINVNWDNEEKSVLLVTFDLPFSVTDLLYSFDEQRGLLSEVDHTTHVIHHMNGPFTELFSWYYTSLEWLVESLPNEKSLIVISGVNKDVVTPTVHNLITDITHRVQLADDLQEARKIAVPLRRALP